MTTFRPHPLDQGCPPAWATGWGEDRYGIFVEFTVAEAVQRMRWIEPGEFQMGSPKDEQGRWGGEGPRHLEKIGEGFWLADTPCTQAVWAGVMGENPSRFQSPDRPVEQVNWEECQDFCRRLAEPTGEPGWRLPTEAEWEYACRAGTTEATYAGPIEILGEANAPVLDRIAWYRGNSGVGYDLKDGWDSSDWKEKQHKHSRAGTRRVKTKAPNPWGLYDTLGNVFEWCQDRWSANYSAEREGTLRVIRGGSWSSSARGCRAAYRDGSGPSGRWLSRGFRLARGQSALR